MTKIIAVLFSALAFSFLASSAFAAQPGMLCVQNQLTALGFDAGTPDGFYGAKTRAAADGYNEWISLKDGDLVLPPLTKTNGRFWCEQVAAANPSVAKFNVPEEQHILLIQFRGDVPASFSVRLGTERVNTSDCPTPCLIDPMKMYKITRDPSGIATTTIALPEQATRACIQMPTEDVLIDSAELMLNSGRKGVSKKGGDLEANGRSACSFSGSDAKKANTWVLTLG